MNFIKKAFSAMGVLCLTLGVCSVVNATKNNVFNDCIEEEVHPFRAVIMGALDTEKTKIFNMISGEYYDYMYQDNYNQTMPSNYKIISVKDRDSSEPHNVRVAELACQEEYRSLNGLYYRGADMGLVVYNAGTLNDSLEDVQSWIKDYKDHVNNDRIILVANKKSSQGSYENDIQIIEQHLGINRYIWVSTDTSEGIDELKDCMGQICSDMLHPEINQDIDITSNSVNSGNKCCR